MVVTTRRIFHSGEAGSRSSISRTPWSASGCGPLCFGNPGRTFRRGPALAVASRIMSGFTSFTALKINSMRFPDSSPVSDHTFREKRGPAPSDRLLDDIHIRTAHHQCDNAAIAGERRSFCLDPFVLAVVDPGQAESDFVRPDATVVKIGKGEGPICFHCLFQIVPNFQR